MKWAKSLHAISVATLLVVVGCSRSSVGASDDAGGRPLNADVGPGCAKDTDCKGDRICEQGRCASPSAPPSSTAPGSASAVLQAASPWVGTYIGMVHHSQPVSAAKEAGEFTVDSTYTLVLTPDAARVDQVVGTLSAVHVGNEVRGVNLAQPNSAQEVRGVPAGSTLVIREVPGNSEVAVLRHERGGYGMALMRPSGGTYAPIDMARK